jgi:hypothetical protein
LYFNITTFFLRGVKIFIDDNVHLCCFTDSPEQSVAPVKSITRPRIDDWEYMNPNRRSTTDTGRLSADVMYGPEQSSLSQVTSLSKQRRNTSQYVFTSHI